MNSIHKVLKLYTWRNKMATKKLKFRLIPVLDGQAELDEQTNNSGNDLSVSEEETEEDSEDELQHNKLVKAIGTLVDKRKRRLRQRSEPSLKVSEFHLNSDSNKVELGDLMGVLQHKGNFGNLKKKLDGLQKNSSVLDIPLAKPQAEQIVRSVAYNETAKDISKWQPIVKKNREAEHLSFPMNAYEPNVPSTKTMTVTFKPRTPLEEEIAAVLRGSADVIERDNKELSKEEEEALKAMDLQEAKERRSELQRLRALQSYYEQKCKRQKKIKSKKYHRIKRRAEKRAAAKKSIEDLQKEEPEKAKEELDKADRLRIMERMSLKHKNTSKWAKNLLIRGHKDPETKRALQEQLQYSHELTRKKLVESEDEEALDDKDKAVDAIETQNVGLVTSEDNPWSLDTEGNSELQKESLDPEHDSSAKLQRLQPITKEDTGETGASEPDDSESEKGTEDEFELQPVVTKPLKKIKNKKNRKKTDENEMKKKKFPKKKKQRINEMKTEKEITKEKKSKKLKKGNKKEDEKRKLKVTPAAADKESENNVMSIDQNVINASDEMVVDKHDSVMRKEVSLDPTKFFRIEDTGTNTEEIGNLDENNKQLIDIRQAFANDDVIEEFVQEKKDMIAAAKPKDTNLFLPGWGEWAGAGVKCSEKKKQKFVIPAEPTPPRKDDNLAHVIINEDRNKQFSKHQVNSLPHPYTNQAQFEQSIRNPVGPHWNTASTVKELTTPKVSTLPGVIIDPIKPTKKIKRRNPDDEKDKSTYYTKRVRKHSSQSAITIHS